MLRANCLIQEPLPDPRALAAGRKGAELTQDEVAAAIGATANKVSRMGLGRSLDAGLLHAYEFFLDSLGDKPSEPAY